MQIISSPKTLNAILESGFIQNILFQGAPFSTVFNPAKTTSNVIIYLELFEINLELIEQIKSAKNKVVLYHMGDELGDKNITAYDACDLVIRNYFFPTIHKRINKAPMILWAPNGYKTGVGPRYAHALQRAGSRQYLACFLGWLSNAASFNGERSLFSEAVHAWKGSKKRRLRNISRWFAHYRSLSKDYLAFTRAAPHCRDDLHLLSSNGFSNGYNIGLYSATMEDSVFAPCPAGNSPETIRLYDALECGCIPVLLKHEFIHSPQALGELGQPPFYLLDSWEQFPEFLTSMKAVLLHHPAEIEQMQARCITWWENYKKHITQKIATHIEGLH